MSVSGQAGPLIVYGQNPAISGTNYQPDYNPDNAPSAFAMGTMLLDPRYGYRAPLVAGTVAAVGFYEDSDYITIDAAPQALNTALIAANQSVASGTPMTLAGAATGLVAITSALTMPQSGHTFPSGTLFIDGAPGMISFGPNGTVQCLDPRTTISRVLQVTAAASATGGAFIIRGYDIYGFAMTESITAVANSSVTGNKAWKQVASITPAFTDGSHNYSVGTTDVYGFPLAAYYFEQVSIVYNNGYITASTGFTAADTTSPATTTSGDVRGTYNIQTAANGTRRLQLSNSPAPYSVANANGTSSLFGVVQNSS